MLNAPTVATVPHDSFLSYLYLSISGTAIVANVAAVAGADPHMALKAVAAAIKPIARPPGICPMNLYVASYRFEPLLRLTRPGP